MSNDQDTIHARAVDEQTALPQQRIACLSPRMFRKKLEQTYLRRI